MPGPSTEFRERLKKQGFRLRSSSPPALVLVVSSALFVDMLVYGLVVPFLPQIVASYGASPAATGVLFGAYAFGLFAFAWPMAQLAPRLGARTTMLLGLLGLIASTLGYIAAHSFAALVVARSLQGVAASATWSAGPMVLASTTVASERGRVMGMAVAGSGLGTLCGPPLGGWLFERGGAVLPFGVAIGLLCILGVLVSLFVPRTLAASTRLPFGRVLRNRNVLLVANIIVCGAGTFTFLEPILPLHLHRRFGLSPSQIGLTFAAAILSYALMASPAGRASDRWGRLRTASCGLLFSAVAIALLPLSPRPAVAVALMALLGAACAFSLSPTMAAMADAVDAISPDRQADYGSVYAIYNGAYAIGMWLGPAAGGSLVAKFGITAALCVAATLAASCAFTTWRASSLPGPQESPRR